MENRILLVDLETTPLVSYNWGIYEQNAIEIITDWHILCFSYKWLGEKKTHVVSLPDFKLYKKDPDNDRDLVKELHKLFGEAQTLVAHNGLSFDFKKANARFIYHGLTPPEPYKTIDTLKVARKYFKFSSNRLDALGDYLKLGRKVHTGGFKLWKDCMEGDLKAFKRMKRYNKQDVLLLEKVYYSLRGWMNPNTSLPEGSVCHVCGATRLQRRGFSITVRGKRQRAQCTQCGAWGLLGKIIK